MEFMSKFNKATDATIAPTKPALPKVLSDDEDDDDSSATKALGEDQFAPW